MLTESPHKQMQAVLGRYVSAINARSIVRCSASTAGVDLDNLAGGDLRRLMNAVSRSLGLFIHGEADRSACIEAIIETLPSEARPPPDLTVRVELESEDDIVSARQLARQACYEMGFDTTTEVKVATAVSELTRNAVRYAGRGTMLLRTSNCQERPHVEIEVRDQGPGIGNLEEIQAGQYRSRTGMGIGLRGTQRLMDEFEIETGATGTTVVIRKYL